MRENLTIGILRETKAWEHRAPLIPAHVKWLIKRGIPVEVEKNDQRAFSNREYERCGARVVDRVQKASLLVGIKEPRVHDLHAHKIYMIFSHTAKGQSHNMPVLKACLKKEITLIDYEKIVDSQGMRLVFFGRFAGVCGIVDTLHYLGRKLEWKGTKNPFSLIKPAFQYDSLKELKQSLEKVSRRIQRHGFQNDLSPFIIGITGHGNVSKGVQEILEFLHPAEIHPRNMKQFIQNQRKQHNQLYKIVFLREEKLRLKESTGFYFEEYLKDPKQFESNMDTYLPYLNLLVHTSYWDSRFPRLVTKKMIHKLSKRKPFRLELIGDISCDINGSIELTYKATSPEKPTYTYDADTKQYVDGYESKGITILAIDNLPAEMPKEASEEFSSLIREYVYQIAAHGVRDITNHMAIPAEIRHAVVTQNGKLSKNARYLKKFITPD